MTTTYLILMWAFIRVAHSDCDVVRHLEQENVDSWLIAWTEVDR